MNNHHCNSSIPKKLPLGIEVHENHNLRLLSFTARPDHRGYAIVKCKACDDIYNLELPTDDPGKLREVIAKAVHEFDGEESMGDVITDFYNKAFGQ